MNDEGKDLEPAGQPAGDGPVLSDDEVNALLSGVESGAVEVHSAAGPRYATVKRFEIPRRSRIATRSLPRLELLNTKFAERLRRRTQQVLDTELEIACRGTESLPFGDVAEAEGAAQLAVEFVLPPLPGSAAIVIDGILMSRLVELFFGGTGNEAGDAAHGAFTPGVIRVAEAYAGIVLDTLRMTWASVQSLDPKQSRLEAGLSLLGIADEADTVLRSVFDFGFAAPGGSMAFLLPAKTVSPLMPYFRGNNREADPQSDQRWADALRDGLPGIAVRLSTQVGNATMTLKDLICLEPGDVIGIDSPTEATILANDVRLLHGRYGVHGGRNAVAARRWIATEDEPSSKGRNANG